MPCGSLFASVNHPPDAEPVAQTVQLSLPAPGSPVQREHQIPGDRIRPDAGRRSAVGSVDVLQRRHVPLVPGLGVGVGQIEVEPGAAVCRVQRGERRAGD